MATANLLCPSWATLIEWRTYQFDLQTFEPLWPEWAAGGTSPTLVEFTSTEEIPQCARLWLLVRVLHAASRRVCLLWAADCAEAALRTQHDNWQIEHTLGVLSEVRRCAMTDECLDTAIVDAADAAYYFPAACAASACAADYSAGVINSATIAVVAAYSSGLAAAAHDAHVERAWQIKLALSYLRVTEMPEWPEGMTWR